MKVNKNIFAGMATLALLLGLSLVGCAGIISVTPVSFVETNTSQEIQSVAIELVDSKEDGITVNELLSSLSNKFSGLTLDNISGGGVNISYEGKKYYINANYVNEGSVVSAVNRNSIIDKVFSVKERE